MKILIFAAAALLFLAPHIAEAQQVNQYTLTIQYLGGTAEPYTISIDRGAKHTVTQPYSWVRDETSRYNLVSYSIDGGDYVHISRSPRGEFTLDVQMDSSRSIIFVAAVQYPISIGSGLAATFSPQSPTHDNWFDMNTEVTFSVPYATAAEEDAGTREQLVSWSLDGSAAKLISPSATSDGTDNNLFSTDVMMSRPHAIDFGTKTQHYVNVISEHGTATPSGWYDSGSTATISVIPPTGEFLIYHKFAGWDGSVAGLSEHSISITVDSPKTLIAKWNTDYTSLALLIAAGAAGAAAFAKIKSKGKRLAVSATANLDAGQTTALHQIASNEHQQATEHLHQKENTAAHAEDLQPLDKNNSYQNQLMEYALQKSIEKLEALRASGIISDAKFSRIKTELEQSFH